MRQQELAAPLGAKADDDDDGDRDHPRHQRERIGVIPVVGLGDLGLERPVVGGEKIAGLLDEGRDSGARRARRQFAEMGQDQRREAVNTRLRFQAGHQGGSRLRSPRIDGLGEDPRHECLARVGYDRRGPGRVMERARAFENVCQWHTIFLVNGTRKISRSSSSMRRARAKLQL